MILTWFSHNDSHVMILTWFSRDDSHVPQTDQLSLCSTHKLTFNVILSPDWIYNGCPYGLISIAASQASPTLPPNPNPPASLTNTRRSDGLGTTVAVLCLLCFVCLHILCVSIQPPPPYTNTPYLVLTINPQRVSPHCHHNTSQELFIPEEVGHGWQTHHTKPLLTTWTSWSCARNAIRTPQGCPR